MVPCVLAALEEINTFQLHIQGKLGSDPGITDVEVPTAWEGISLSYEVNKLTQTEVLQLSMALQVQRAAVKEIVAKMELLTVSSSSIDRDDLQKVTHECASQLKAFHGQVSSTLNGSIGPILQSLGNRLGALEETLQQTQPGLWLKWNEDGTLK